MRKPGKPGKLPKFASEAAEREFWRTHDTAEFFDLRRAPPVVFTNLKPSTKVVSIRLPNAPGEAQDACRKEDLPYQSLLKLLLAEKVQEEIRKVS